MAGNLYEAVYTRNSTLAKFFDQNYNMALLVKKIIGLIAQIAHDWKADASSIEFPNVNASPDGKLIVIHLKRKG